MQLRLFRIPVNGCPATEAELNAFLRGQRVLKLDRQLVERDSAPAWAVCVEYLGPASAPGPAGAKGRVGSSKIDYRELLSPDDFALYSKLRQLRKELAEKEGVPVYAIFTNEQLGELAKARPQSRSALGGIAGIGEGRVEKYAEAVLPLLGVPSNGPDASGGDEP